MKCRIGAYTIESEDGFSTEKEAIAYIVERHPELEEIHLIGKLNSLINVNKSGNSIKEDNSSGEKSARIHYKGARTAEAGEDQSE